MPRTIEIFIYDGRFELYRHNWSSNFDFAVSIKNLKNSKKKNYILARNQKLLAIDNLDPEEEYTIVIKGLRLIDRFKQLPRKINLFPKQKQLRVMFIGSGRCGTTSIAHFLNGKRFLNGEKIIARHETMFDEILPAIIRKDYDLIKHFIIGFRHNIESAPHFGMLRDLICANKIIHLIRDGRRVVQSGMNRGWYQNDDIWNNSKPTFTGSIFEKCCKFWVYMVQNATVIADKTFRLEDLSTSNITINGLLEEIEIRPTQKNLPVANVGKTRSHFSKWSKIEKQTFEEICGTTMTLFYPQWQNDY